MTEFAIKTTIKFPGDTRSYYIANGFGQQGTVKITYCFQLVRTFKTRSGAERFLAARSFEIPGGEVVAAPSVVS